MIDNVNRDIGGCALDLIGNDLSLLLFFLCPLHLSAHLLLHVHFALIYLGTAAAAVEGAFLNPGTAFRTVAASVQARQFLFELLFLIHAFADGTGLNGTTKAENNAVVSEYGQTEMTVFPNGRTVITDSPTAMKMPKGTVVYNEEQTDMILKNKGTVTSNAYVNGTSSRNISEGGTVLRRVPYDDPAYDIDRKFEAYMGKTGSNVDIITRSGLIRYDNDMGEVVKNVTNVSNVTNNNRNMQPVINIGDITVQGVQDVTGFARAIKTHFSNAMLQEMYKR